MLVWNISTTYIFKGVKITMKWAAESAMEVCNDKICLEVRSGLSEEGASSTKHEELTEVSKAEEHGKDYCRKEHV